MTNEKRKAPVRSKRFELPFEDYQGWWFEARTGLTVAEYVEVQASISEGRTDLADTRDFVAARLIGWNFVDAAGDDLAPSPEGIDQIEIPLLNEMSRLIWEAINSVPLAFSASSSPGPSPA